MGFKAPGGLLDEPVEDWHAPDKASLLALFQSGFLPGNGMEMVVVAFTMTSGDTWIKVHSAALIAQINGSV